MYERKRETLLICFLLVSTFYLDCYELDQGQGSSYHFWASVPIVSNFIPKHSYGEKHLSGFLFRLQFLFYLKRKRKKG